LGLIQLAPATAATSIAINNACFMGFIAGGNYRVMKLPLRTKVAIILEIMRIFDHQRDTPPSGETVTA
jgi:hypothetical protein